MPKLTLSFIAPPDNERVTPLLDGTVEPEDIELVPTRSLGTETFWRQLRFREFDIAAMSISSYMIARPQGLDMVAIPVFPSRRFMHMGFSYHVDSGVKRPEDLTGKRVGVEEYQMTAAVWSRGIFEHDFGVSQYQVHWHMERTEELSHGGATGFTPPKGISFQRVPTDKSLASMLVNHEIDVATVNRAFRNEANLIDRSVRIRGTGANWGKVRPLFPDVIAEGTRFFKKHGYIPANNIYVIRGDILRRHEWVAVSLYHAFMKAKQRAQDRLVESIPSGLVFGAEYLEQTRAIFGEDPFPYGIKQNRPMMENLIDYSREQGLIATKPKVEDLFTSNTLEL
jgi:4,5-dihydroxyphthalate decarboxylase